MVLEYPSKALGCCTPTYPIHLPTRAELLPGRQLWTTGFRKKSFCLLALKNGLDNPAFGVEFNFAT